MSKTTIDQALDTLALALKDLEPKPVTINYRELISSIPNRALSGDLIFGGTIRNFSSAGITDSASSTKITITDNAVTVSNLDVTNIVSDVTVKKSLKVDGTITAHRLEVNELQADLRLERSSPLEFKATPDSSIVGKGLWFSGQGYTKQFIFSGNPERFFSTESLDLAADRAYYINGVKVIDATSLSPAISKSNLKEVGRLTSLEVNGNVKINNDLFYSAGSRRLGLGTETPNAAFSVVNNSTEVIIEGTAEAKGKIGTYTHSDLEIVTDNVVRVTVSSSGAVSFGAAARGATQVTIHGKVSVGVNTPDPQVDLHVNGAVRFNNILQTTGTEAPSFGAYKLGDIVWNVSPAAGGWMGWVCIATGSPGQWRQFGAIAR